MSARLALGTAQLGAPYGIANRRGQPSAAEVEEILAFARRAGIDTIDTAAAYGDAEAVLGEAGTADMRVISKLPPEVQPGEVGAAIERSLQRLRRSSLSGLLLHRVSRDSVTLRLLEAVHADERIQQTGVSLYEPADLDWLLEQDVPLELVQIPFSVFDQRFGSRLDALASRGVEIHVRSVFLQGLYFLADDELTGQLARAAGPLGQLRGLARDAGLPVATILLRYVSDLAPVGRVVVGVEALSQLEANVAALTHPEDMSGLRPALDALALHDEDVLLPSRWLR